MKIKYRILRRKLLKNSNVYSAAIDPRTICDKCKKTSASYINYQKKIRSANLEDFIAFPFYGEISYYCRTCMSNLYQKQHATDFFHHVSAFPINRTNKNVKLKKPLYCFIYTRKMSSPKEFVNNYACNCGRESNTQINSFKTNSSFNFFDLVSKHRKKATGKYVCDRCFEKIKSKIQKNARIIKV